MSATETTGEHELRYLLVLTDPSLAQRMLDECSAYRPRQIFDEPAAVTVLEITSPRRFATLEPSPHQLIESDLTRMREECSFFGESFLELDGAVVGQRWPILVETGGDEHTGPDAAAFESTWNNLILHGTGPELADRMIDVAGHCLATYYILRKLDGLTTELARLLLDEGSFDGGQRPIDGWTQRREAMLAAQVLADPRRILYWGCETELYQSIKDQWGIDELNETVHRSAGLLSQVVHDRSLRSSAAQQAASVRAARRAAVVLLLLTVISGVSALTTLIEFGVSGNQPQANAWRVAISALLLAATVVLIVINARALRAHTITGLSNSGGPQ